MPMHAAVVRSFDQPPRYEVCDTPEPAGPDESLVDVLAVGLHPRVRTGASGRHYSGRATLPMIPGVDGHLEVCQLVAINLTDIVVKGSWIGPGRLHLVPHVNAPVADFPVRRVIGAHHFLADLTLPFGRVVHDYNKEAGQVEATGLAAE